MSQATRPRSPLVKRLALTAALVLVCVLGGAPHVHSQGFTFTDINPSWSNGDAADADRATGGRVNGLAADPNDSSIFYAASEWGGIYRSEDSGHNWFRLNGHNPNVTWDVEVKPGDSNVVFASSFYDGRVSSLSGINVSTNGGTSWSRPATAEPPVNFCNNVRARTEPSAFGISIDPDSPDDIYIGTNCGLAVSTDSGASWSFIDPDPGAGADFVIDVVVHHGIIDLCGYAGHMRSEDGGATWSVPSPDLAGGTCSIAASPDEPDVIFVTVGADIYESDDGGASWTLLGTPDSDRQGRIPFVAVNDRSDDSFDLWYGDIRLYRGSCTSDPDGGGTRCPVAFTGDPGSSPPAGWAGPYTRGAGGHDDVGDIVFDTSVAVDACPEVFSSDGGVYWNERDGSNCHAPAWEQPATTPHALWLWALAGVDRPFEVEEYLYFGNQDNGTFGTINGGAEFPIWNNNKCCDGFDFAAVEDLALYTVCCSSPRANKLYLGNPGLTSNPEVNSYPADGLIPGFTFPDVLDTYGPARYVILTRDCRPPADTDGDGDIDDDDDPPEGACSGDNGGDGGIYITDDITAVIPVWTEIGDATEPPTGGDLRACAVKASVNDDGVPTFYVQDGLCSGVTQDRLWRFVGTDPDGSWTLVNLPAAGISVFDVDPTNPDRLFVSAYLGFSNLDMMLSEDGGTTWTPLPELDDLMIGGGAYKLENYLGPYTSKAFWGYPQPSLVAFDPEDENILVAGGRDSGVFLSTDGGEDWVLVTDPDSTVGTPPHLPRPWFAYFDHEPADQVNMYIGTRGRGVWRINFGRPPIADAGGPYETDEGMDVTLDGTASFDPVGGSLTYEWDFDDDGQFDDAAGATPDFDPVGDGVGQDGVYTVRLRVTNEDDLSDIDEATVTVDNVAPTVTFDPQDPEDEGAPLVVTGTVSDPGWLDPLSATIDWGDGSPVEDIDGTLENDRPEATLTFSVSHCYGDNGLYPVEICGFDDDTSTCETIDVTINNVPPSVAIDDGQITEIDEGETIDVLAHFSDPGWLDTYISSIDWDYDGWMEPGSLTVTSQGSGCDDPDVGTVTGSKQYGDNDDGGGFTVAVSVTDDDGGTGVAAFSLTVNNIDPTAEIDETDAVDFCGAAAIIAHAGEDVNFSGRSTDPGSDDLFLSWDWDDGPPAPDVTTDYLVGVPVPGSSDPLPSPEVSARDVTDTKTHVFAAACYYNVRFLADDDDGGHAGDDTDVVIVGNAELIRSAGYWYKAYRQIGRRVFTDEELECFLAVVNHSSAVFSEMTDADTIDDAEEVLDPSNSNGTIQVQFDRQLLALWFNFANGAVDYDELVDTDFDFVPDTPLLDVLCAAEAARLDPTTPDWVLEDWKDILDAINLTDET